MFTPEKPDPHKYHKPAVQKPKPKMPGDEGALTTIIMQLIVIAVLIAAIAAIIYSAPKEKPLVCDKSRYQHSLTAFGSCHREGAQR